MGVIIRMARHGKTKAPSYRIVATDGEMKRDGRYLELLGTMQPKADPPLVKLREDRVRYWISVGAKTSPTCGQLIEKVIPGLLSELEAKRLAKKRSLRAKRKARNKKSAGAAPKKRAESKKASAKK